MDPSPSPLPVWRVVLAGGDDPGMQLELSGVEVRGESWIERCACTIENASAYVVTVITVIESRSLSLVSAYVADLSGQTAVTHMRPRARPRARASSSRSSEDFLGCRIRGRACSITPPSCGRSSRSCWRSRSWSRSPRPRSSTPAPSGAPLPQPEPAIGRGPDRASGAAAPDGIGPPRARRLAGACSAGPGTPRRGWRAPVIRRRRRRCRFGLLVLCVASGDLLVDLLLAIAGVGELVGVFERAGELLAGGGVLTQGGVAVCLQALGELGQGVGAVLELAHERQA